MYIRVWVSVTRFLLFEARVDDWHVKQVAYWNKVFIIVIIYAQEVNQLVWVLGDLVFVILDIVVLLY